MARIVLTTFGSLGDLHPYLALAIELQHRGHGIVIATQEGYREKVEAEGIGFRGVRPHPPDPKEDPAFVARAMDRWRGGRFLIRDYMMAGLRDSYADLLAAVHDANLLVTHPITYAGPIVAQITGIQWVSTVLSPLSFFSAYEPLRLPSVDGFERLHWLGPSHYGALLRSFKRVSYPWGEEARRLRVELGLPPGRDPLFEGQHSPQRVLALFSPVLGAPQPDWPPQAQTTGFLFYDRHGSHGMPPALLRFLESGPPPLVFTLGSAAVLVAGDFYQESIEAAQRLGMRAVLLTGPDPRYRPAKLPDGIIACDYAPYSEILPHAAAIVHQGGVGTTAQALRAGRPMLIVPHGHDQPDNALRCVRLGVARSIRSHRYNANRAVRELQLLINNPHHAAQAAEIGAQIQAEAGACRAADAIEELLD